MFQVYLSVSLETRIKPGVSACAFLRGTGLSLKKAQAEMSGYILVSCLFSFTSNNLSSLSVSVFISQREIPWVISETSLLLFVSWSYQCVSFLAFWSDAPRATARKVRCQHRVSIKHDRESTSRSAGMAIWIYSVHHYSHGCKTLNVHNDFHRHSCWHSLQQDISLLRGCIQYNFCRKKMNRGVVHETIWSTQTMTTYQSPIQTISLSVSFDHPKNSAQLKKELSVGH